MKSAYFCKDSLLKSGELTETLFTSTSEGSFSRPKGRKFSLTGENFISGTVGARRVLSSSTPVKFVECQPFQEKQQDVGRGSWVVGSLRLHTNFYGGAVSGPI